MYPKTVASLPHYTLSFLASKDLARKSGAVFGIFSALRRDWPIGASLATADAYMVRLAGFICEGPPSESRIFLQLARTIESCLANLLP